MRRITTVLFDLDDTLHDDTFAFRSAAADAARMLAERTGADPVRLAAAYVRVAEDFWTQLTAEGLDADLSGVRRRLWARALEATGTVDAGLAEEAAALYNSQRKSYFAPFPGAVDLLTEQRRRGRRLGLVTNGFSETHREKIALLRLEACFDAIFIADEVGMLKPDPALFEHACERLGDVPERAAMVGDRYERDIAGAVEAGLFTLWFNFRDETVPPGAAAPDAICRSLDEVARVLEALP